MYKFTFFPLTDKYVPLKDVQRHVQLWLISRWSSHQFALGMSRDEGAIGEREPIKRAESVTVPQHWRNPNRHLQFYSGSGCVIMRLKSYLLAGVSWRWTFLRRSGGEISGYSVGPDRPSPASWTLSTDWCPER